MKELNKQDIRRAHESIDHLYSAINSALASLYEILGNDDKGIINHRGNLFQMRVQAKNCKDYLNTYAPTTPNP